MEEKRLTPRVGISFPVECIPLTSREYFYTVSKDLSMGGVKIVSNKFLARGNSLKLNINFVDHLVKLRAKVAWCNKERVSERYAVGLEFQELSYDNQKVLSEFLGGIN